MAASRKTVTLIGPVAPFRGGVARHTTSLAVALALRSELKVEVESFARLYPALLYPGASDRDPDLADQGTFSARFAMNTLNPFTWKNVAARLARQDGGIAVIPAWTFFVAPMLGTMARRLRDRGLKVLMIVHNASDHDSNGWKSRLLNWQLAGADGFIAHTHELERQLAAAGHRQPVAVVPHPPYSDFPPATGMRPREYGLELLCFGLVRHYKGVDIALRALAAAGLSDVRLTIAGELWDGGRELRNLIKAPGLRCRVDLIDRYVSDSEAADLFTRSDAVLAPYRSVTGSGVLALAQHYRRPVVAADLPGLAEFIEHEKTGWLFPAEDATALCRLLQLKVTRAAAEAMQPELEMVCRQFGWDDYADAVLHLADRIASSVDDAA